MGYKVNRFPICAIAHAAIAYKKAKFDWKESQAIGLACAIFYANAKFGRFQKKSKKSSSTQSSKIPSKDLIRIHFGERVFKGVIINGFRFPVMGNKVITDKDFYETLRRKFSDEEIEAILDYALKWAESLPDGAERVPYRFYQAIRDEWRTEEFWNNLLSKKEIDDTENVIPIPPNIKTAYELMEWAEKVTKGKDYIVKKNCIIIKEVA